MLSGHVNYLASGFSYADYLKALEIDSKKVFGFMRSSLHGNVETNDLMKPFQLKQHLPEIHPALADKGPDSFESEKRRQNTAY